MPRRAWGRMRLPRLPGQTPLPGAIMWGAELDRRSTVAERRRNAVWIWAARVSGRATVYSAFPRKLVPCLECWTQNTELRRAPAGGGVHPTRYFVR